MYFSRSIMLYLFFIFILFGNIQCTFAKDYVFIGVPSISKIERLVGLLDDKKGDKISFVIPEFSKEVVEEALKLFPKNINLVSYIPGITEEKVDSEIDILDRHFDDVELAYKKIHNKLPKVSGILAACEYSMYSAARLRTKYGVPGLQEAQGLYFRDKFAMKERLSSKDFRGRRVKLNIPKYANLDKIITFDHVKSRMKSAGISYPLILKPRGSAGAIGIYLAKNDNEIKRIISKINNNIPYEINEFIDAQIIHSNGVVKDGKIIMISNYGYGSTPLETGCYGDAAQTSFEIKDTETEKRLFDISSEIIFRLGMKNGVFHLELFRDKNNKITFLEIAARPPGDEGIPLIEVATGVNIYDLTFLICMNSPTWEKRFARSFIKKNKYHGLYLTAFGQDHSVKITKVDTSKIKGVNIEKQVLPSIGQIIKADNSTYKNFGFFIFSSETAAGLEKAYHKIRDNYVVEFQPTNEI